MIRLFCQVAIAAAVLVPTAAVAQTAHTGPIGAVEFAVGYAGAVDDAIIDHSVWGGSGRIHVSPLLSVGPEVVYMRGPRGHYDVMVTGNLTVDFRGEYGRGARLMPFAVVGGGIMRTSERFASGRFTSSDPAFTAGVGLRGSISDRVFVGGDVRVGWELHTRAAALVGVRFGS